jgi:hypothetical protein
MANCSEQWFRWDGEPPIPALLRALATRLDPIKSEGVQLSVGFGCTDTDRAYGLVIHSAVAEVHPEVFPGATIKIRTSEPVLRGLLTGRTGWPQAQEDRIAFVNRGAAEEVARFWSLFDPAAGDLPALALR